MPPAHDDTANRLTIMCSGAPRLPNFFVVGAPKAGTTSLFHYLDQHPQIYMSPVKEPAYFSLEFRPENFVAEMQAQVRRDVRELREYLDGPMTAKRFGGPVTEWDDYLRLFRHVREEPAIGEASVCYLWSETAPGRIASRFPAGKIIMILRDPADRAFSQYLHALGAGETRNSFREFVNADLKCHSNRLTRSHPFLEFGNYYEQVKRYLDLFPSENIRIFLYDDYHRDPHAVLREIFEFLSVAPDFSPDTTRRYLEPRIPRFQATGSFLRKAGLWQRAREMSPRALRRLLRPFLWRTRTSLRMEPVERALLVDYYRDDVQKTSRLLNRDLSSWSAR